MTTRLPDSARGSIAPPAALPAAFPAAEPLRPPRLGPSSAELSPRLAEILDQLERIVVTEGFRHLTVSDLAARLHCSRRTLYELSSSRDELVLIVVDRWLRRVGRQARDQLRNVDGPDELLTAFLTVPLQELHRHTARFSADVSGQPALQRLLTAHRRYYVAILRAILDDGVRDGHLTPFNSAVVAELVDAAMERFWQPRFLAENSLTYEDAVAELSAIVRAALVRTPSAGRSST